MPPHGTSPRPVRPSSNPSSRTHTPCRNDPRGRLESSYIRFILVYVLNISYLRMTSTPQTLNRIDSVKSAVATYMRIHRCYHQIVSLSTLSHRASASQLRLRMQRPVYGGIHRSTPPLAEAVDQPPRRPVIGPRLVRSGAYPLRRSLLHTTVYHGMLQYEYAPARCICHIVCTLSLSV